MRPRMLQDVYYTEIVTLKILIYMCTLNRFNKHWIYS